MSTKAYKATHSKANSNSTQSSYSGDEDDEEDFEHDNDHEATQMTCDALCSLSAASPHNLVSSGDFDPIEGERKGKHLVNGKSCPKQLQLPMFLSKTYHMIDRCDSEVATWSEAGDNFVVKNVEKFATAVLPLYFKHSNFSSFARQLNFYGFRKLRSDPILTNDVDPRTASFVRFFHEKFQKNKPDLLHQIKRATKTDQQSKDDVDILKQEVQRLKDCNAQMKDEFDRRLAELSYECNRRVTALSADYDKLVSLVQPLLQHQMMQQAPRNDAALLQSLSAAANQPDLLQSLMQLRAAAVNPSAVAQAALLNEAVAQRVTSTKRHRDDYEAGQQQSALSRARYEQ